MRLHILGLALMSVFVMGASAASSAYAEQLEFANFTANVPFKSTSGPSEFLTVGGVAIRCTADSDSGEVTGKKTGTLTITLTGCATEMLGIKIKCTTGGAPPGTIATSPLASMLVWLTNSKGEKIPGIDLKPASGTLLLECSLEGLAIIKIRGSVLAPITPPNSPSTTFKLVYGQSKGIQGYASYQETCSGTLIKDVLETKGEGSKVFGYEQSGFIDEDILTFAKQQEIKAMCP